MPNSLIEPANNIPANPMQTPNHIVQMVFPAF